MTSLDLQRIGPPTIDPVDAILLVSFGGPEQPDDVMPFLRNVTAGRGVPDERLALVAEQYAVCGGRSPINDQNRSLLAALEPELRAHGIDLPVYWGNRNWDPYLSEAMDAMVRDGRRHAVAFVTSAYSSYSSCRQYRDDIERARDAAGPSAPIVTKARQFFNHPDFIEPLVRNVQAAVDELGGVTPEDVRIAFTAHSIPTSMASTSHYEAQLRETARLVIERLDGRHPWDLVFQSRSGPPQVPWLEPDIRDHLAALRDQDVRRVVMAPIGFVSDHMEVIYDLDTAAKETAVDLGMEVARARTPGTDPQFVTMVRELIEEVVEGRSPATVGDLGPVGCQGAACCPAPRRPGH